MKTGKSRILALLAILAGTLVMMGGDCGSDDSDCFIGCDKDSIQDRPLVG